MNSYSQSKILPAYKRTGFLLVLAWIIGTLALSALALGALLMTPTAIWLAFNGISPLSPTTVYAIPAPDSKYEIVVTKQVHLPTFDLLDEPTTIAVELRDIESQQVLDSVRFEPVDICHLNKPQIAWNGDSVRIENVDTYVKRDINFNLPSHSVELP